VAGNFHSVCFCIRGGKDSVFLYQIQKVFYCFQVFAYQPYVFLSPVFRGHAFDFGLLI